MVGLVPQAKRFAHFGLVELELLPDFAQFIRRESFGMVRDRGVNISRGFQREDFLSALVANFHLDVRDAELLSLADSGDVVPFERAERDFATAGADGVVRSIHIINVEAGESRPRVRVCCKSK